MSWKFLNTGFRTGTFNMQLDEALALRLKDESGSPTLRVYGWDPTTISIGFNQQMEDFDLRKVLEDGIEIVRRPTGGRAILHAHELTYSVVLHRENRGPLALYRLISEGLLQSLKLLGIEAQLSTNEVKFKQTYQHSSSIPCFSSSAKYEIQYDGRKLIGSAQRRYGDIVLQHGSLLLGPQHRTIVDYLAPRAHDSKRVLEEHLLTHTTDVETILGRRVNFEEAADCMRKGFEFV